MRFIFIVKRLFLDGWRSSEVGFFVHLIIGDVKDTSAELVLAVHAGDVSKAFTLVKHGAVRQ